MPAASTGTAPDGPLVECLADSLAAVADLRVVPTAFDPSVLADHLRMHFVASDDEGTVHGVGTDLGRSIDPHLDR